MGFWNWLKRKNRTQSPEEKARERIIIRGLREPGVTPLFFRCACCRKKFLVTKVDRKTYYQMSRQLHAQVERAMRKHEDKCCHGSV